MRQETADRLEEVRQEIGQKLDRIKETIIENIWKPSDGRYQNVLKLECSKRDTIAQGVKVHPYMEVGDELFAHCDFHSASKEIILNFKGREIPIELGVLLHNYIRYPSRITATPLIKYDKRFARYFTGKGKCKLLKQQCAV